MSERESSRDVMIVSSVSREQRDSLPPLIQDARENPLVVAPTSEGNVYVRPIAMPYTRHHMLVIPDLMNGENAPSVASTPKVLLGQTLDTAYDIADYYTQNPEVSSIDAGFNYSKFENVKRIASQQNNLHVHVIGYDERDRTHRIDISDAFRRSDLKTKMVEPLAHLASELLYDEVLPVVKADQPQYFNENFEVDTQSNRFTLKVKSGLNVLNNPGTIQFLKSLHAEGQQLYDEVEKCFFAYDESNHSFREEVDGRYELLPAEQRTKRVYNYLAHHDNLSVSSRRILLQLASLSKSTEDIVKSHASQADRGPTEEDQKRLLNRFMAIKNFAYATVFSGVKTDEGMTWKFGFDPVIFSTRDILQASRGEMKLFERNPDAVYDKVTLAKVKQEEMNLCDHLLDKENSPYQIGNGYQELK